MAKLISLKKFAPGESLTKSVKFQRVIYQRSQQFEFHIVERPLTHVTLMSIRSKCRIALTR